ncbi:hypothetical protein [Pseudomonas sp.]|uniref:hypothetical protein n=1 Tax=Pseudomonas sp. TaxID=306 RepID=UPI0023534DFF|nr:hypothetical protein [Pseudomonas sp.]
MRLIRRQDRERLGISFRNIESPFFAKANVERALHLPHTPLNLSHVDAFGRPMSDQQIVEAVEKVIFVCGVGGGVVADSLLRVAVVAGLCILLGLQRYAG